MKDFREGRIHRAIWRYYQGLHTTKEYQVTRPFPQLVMWHPSNESWGHTAEDKKRGAIQQKMGLVKGAFDFTCIWPGAYGKGIVEVKAPGGRLDAAQIKFRDRIHYADGKTAEVYSVAQFRDTLIAWGLKCENTAAVEPDLRTDAEKKEDAFNFYAPSKT